MTPIHLLLIPFQWREYPHTVLDIRKVVLNKRGDHYSSIDLVYTEGLVPDVKGRGRTVIYTGTLIQERSPHTHLHCTQDGPSTILPYTRRKYGLTAVLVLTQWSQYFLGTVYLGLFRYLKNTNIRIIVLIESEMSLTLKCVSGSVGMYFLRRRSCRRVVDRQVWTWP